MNSGKIRMNANGRRIDAWLVYNCAVCQNSWNRPLLERRNVGDIDPSMRQALQTNDPRLVRRAAFDVDELKRKAERVEESDAVTIHKSVLSAGEAPFSQVEIGLNVTEPTALRADRLLASELDVSRARLQAMSADGRLTLFPHGVRMLRRPVRDGTRIAMAVSAEVAIDVRRIAGDSDAC